MIGTSLGHYRIVEKIGAGGMGEFFRATDTKLGRDVAIKILSGEFADAGDKMMVVSLETDPTFTATKARVLFADPYVKQDWFLANYDVSPDGQSFLMMKSEGVEAARLVLVQNWPELLKPSRD